MRSTFGMGRAFIRTCDIAMMSQPSNAIRFPTSGPLMVALMLISKHVHSIQGPSLDAPRPSASKVSPPDVFAKSHCSEVRISSLAWDMGQDISKRSEP